MNTPQQVRFNAQNIGPHAGDFGYDRYGNGVTPQQWEVLQNNPQAYYNPQQPSQYSPSAYGSSQFHPRFPAPYQQQVEQLFGNTLNKFNKQFEAGAPSDIDPILNQARLRFNTQTVPGIAEKFTSLGGSGSHAGSNFINQIGGANAGLESDLEALRAQYNLYEKNNLLQQFQALNPYEQVYTEGGGYAPQQPQQSRARQVFNELLKAGGAALTGAVTGFLSPVPGGAAAGAIGGAGASLINSLTQNNGVTPEQIGQVYSSLRANRNQEPGAITPTADQQKFLDDLSKRAGQNLTPADIQQINAITGGGTGAAEDFQRTFKQPNTSKLSYAQRMKLRKQAQREAALGGTV
jgi:hypothetical protein